MPRDRAPLRLPERGPPGQPRDAERRDRILGKLGQLWARVPDWRLAWLIVNLVPPGPPASDTEVELDLDRLLMLAWRDDPESVPDHDHEATDDSTAIAQALKSLRDLERFLDHPSGFRNEDPPFSAIRREHAEERGS